MNDMKKIKSFSGINMLSPKDYIDTLLKLASRFDIPFAHDVCKAILENKIPNLDVDPADFTDPSSYLEHKQIAALFSKNPLLDFGIDTTTVALERALLAEVQCLNTNLRFQRILNGSNILPAHEYDLIHSTRYFIKEILGTYDHCSVQPNFGPGATSQLKGSFTNLVSKLGKLPECTSYGHDFIMRTILDKMPAYSISCGLVERGKHYVRLTSRHLPVVDFDQIHFVDKSYKTKRAIFIGPMGNTMVQKGQGSLIRKKLKTYGLDLDNTADLHGEYSRVGSIDGSIATIDLANASDTISLEVVRMLLPDDWFDALNSTRVHRSDYGFGPIRNEKFSAMGNGFTWELESLIFYAIGLAVRYLFGKKSDVVSTFGDDICVSTQIAESMISALQFFGFTVNEDKTFIDGSFRESCGFDYMAGLPVTPVYFKDAFGERKPIETLYYLLNRIRQMAHNYNFGCGCSDLFRTVWEGVLRRLPPDLRFYGTAEYGDQVLLAPYRGYRGTYLQRKPKRFKLTGSADHDLACALYGIAPSGVSYRGAPFEIRRDRKSVV